MLRLAGSPDEPHHLFEGWIILEHPHGLPPRLLGEVLCGPLYYRNDHAILEHKLIRELPPINEHRGVGRLDSRLPREIAECRAFGKSDGLGPDPGTDQRDLVQFAVNLLGLPLVPPV